MKKKMFPATTVVVLLLAVSNFASADSFIGGGLSAPANYTDANKTWTNDTLLCWAATASNVLYYSGWNGGFASAGAIFDYFKGTWSDGTGNAWWAIDWFLSGATSFELANHTFIPMPGTTSNTAVGGGFYPGVYEANVGDPSLVGNYTYDAGNDLWAAIKDYVGRWYDPNLDNQPAVYLSLENSNSTTGHAVTLWGYGEATVSGGNTIRTIYISDSDDNDTGGEIKSYTLGIDGTDHYFLENYSAYSTDKFYLDEVSRLNMNLNDVQPGPGNTTNVPEPSSVVLVGIGLTVFTLVSRRRKS